MDNTAKYRCLDCQEVSWTTADQGCKSCGSLQLEVVSNEKAVSEEEERERTIKNTGIALLVIIVLFWSGFISITTEGCTLPIDIVIGNACLFGSFGATVGATLAVGVLMALLAIIGRFVKSLFK